MRSNRPSPAAIQATAKRLRTSPYLLTADEITAFWELGVSEPLTCEAPELHGLLGRLQAGSSDQPSAYRNIYDPQRSLNTINELACHASIVHRVAQLLGTEELSFFQARFRVKEPGRLDDQPWHQDVGKNHGGLFNDGSPVPSLTVWLSLDGANASSGSVVVIPRTHHNLLGNWQAGYQGLQGMEHNLNTRESWVLSMMPNQFHIFHSWAVHCSLTNHSNRLRSALILRYMDRRHAMDASFPHRPCNAA